MGHISGIKSNFLKNVLTYYFLSKCLSGFSFIINDQMF